MSGLSDLLQRLNTEGWSSRRIEREAERHGYRLSNATVARYLRGAHPPMPATETLQAFADVFRVDVNRLAAAAGQPSIGEPFDLGPESARLTGPQREAVRHVVRVMLDQNEALDTGVEDRAQPDGATRRSDLRLAAYRGTSKLEAMDAAADRAGEESQDPEDYR
ncbi:hypothetical protein [Brachybacterium hainanense]|uniref:HTH cro/C1-type domain-containing protein n=1 Tax=Brachybacterium hainanense TaxID=1541174 RepID=A0ABV6R939_9MICO